MSIKIRVYGELSAILGVELVIDEKEGVVKEILKNVLENKGIKLKDLEQDYVVLVNGKKARMDSKIREGDIISILPIFFGG